MVVDHLESYRTLTAAVSDVARKLGCSSDSLQVWYKQSRRESGPLIAVPRQACFCVRAGVMVLFEVTASW
jgi:transposase-like protein